MSYVSSRSQLLELCNKHGLSKHAEKIVGLSRSSIWLPTSKATTGELALGESRIGGLPDVPPGFTWPVYNDQPLAFIAQIDLAAMSVLPPASDLPQSGHLLFFYDAEEQPWGFDPNNAGGSRVVYLPAAELVRAATPSGLPEGSVFDALRITAKERLTLAPWESSTIQQLDFSPDERGGYMDIFDDLEPEDDGKLQSQLLGHPHSIQGDMELECALVTSGLYCGDGSAYDDPKAKELAKHATSWRLLCQIDSEEEAGMTWGDVGRLYFWIHEDDLKAARFDKVWTILQCY